MKANELRIGNWVEIIQPKKGIYTTVEQSTFSTNIENSFKPIILTEEWLLKFGFEFYETEKANNYIMKKSWRFTFPTEGKNKGSMYLHYGNIIWHNSSNMQYVHQLQNLYFALMGEELTIKQS